MSQLATEPLVSLVSHGMTLQVKTNSERLLKFLREDPFVRHHIPGFEFEPNSQTYAKPTERNANSYQIVFDESSEEPYAGYTPSQRCLYIRGMLGRDYSEIMFVFNALQFFSRMYQEHNIFAIHSGGVTLGAGAALILGGAEAGKSTTTALLCAKFGATYLCDERALLRRKEDTIHWIGGNTVLRLRVPSSGSSPVLGGLETIFRDVTKASVAKHKLCFLARSVCTTQIPIRHIFFVKLTSNESRIWKHHHESAIYKLFAALSENIHGEWCPILSASYAMPSLDSDELCQRRLQMARALAGESIALWTCVGETSDVCEMIVETVLKDV